MTGIGILLDADTNKSPADRYASIRDALRAKGFDFPDDAGVVSAAAPRLGAFVLPDNQAQGTLEDVLLECANQVYPVWSTATAHVHAALHDSSLVAEDLKELQKRAAQQGHHRLDCDHSTARQGGPGVDTG